MAEVTTVQQHLTADDFKKAIFVQSACNLSGLVHSFSKVMSSINAEARDKGHGTEWVNTHPICRLYAEQISHLTSKARWDESYNVCEERGEV